METRNYHPNIVTELNTKLAKLKPILIKILDEQKEKKSSEIIIIEELINTLEHPQPANQLELDQRLADLKQLIDSNLFDSDQKKLLNEIRNFMNNKMNPQTANQFGGANLRRIFFKTNGDTILFFDNGKRQEIKGDLPLERKETEEEMTQRAIALSLQSNSSSLIEDEDALLQLALAESMKGKNNNNNNNKDQTTIKDSKMENIDQYNQHFYKKR